MKKYPALSFASLLLLATGFACSQSGGTGTDPPPPPDLGAATDLSPAPDLAVQESRELSLLAGGIGGQGNVDAIGTEARFARPAGMATDGAGNLFVADSGSNLIRKVSLATGAVETLAGGPRTVGHDDGVGAAARFYVPTDVVFDGVGALYVADKNNNMIRKVVVATGAVTTLAGSRSGSSYEDGVGAAAGFNSPSGLTIDGAGSLFVSDGGNHTIRKIVVATATVTTLAGFPRSVGSMDGIGGAARFKGPGLLAYDGAGNLFIADSGNHTIRKLVLSTGEVTTVAGAAGVAGATDGIGSVARFTFPEGVVFDGAGSLFIPDILNHAIRKFSLATGEVTTLCGSPRLEGSADGIGDMARLYQPRGVAPDGRGNLFIADAGNYLIRKVDLASRRVTTPLGATPKRGGIDGVRDAARFFEPRVAVDDGAGNLYVADTANYTIRKVVLSSGVVSTLAGSVFSPGSDDGVGPAARFSDIRGLALDGAGNLFVADFGNHTIRKLELSTNRVTTFAGSPRMGGSSDGIGAAARFESPRGLAFDGAGNLYVADSSNSAIRKIDVASGAVTTFAGTPTMYGGDDGIGNAARFLTPSGLAVDGAGNLYVTDLTLHTIRKIELATRAVTTPAGLSSRDAGSDDGVGDAARFNAPEGLTVDPAGNVYIADTGNSLLRKLDPKSRLVTTVLGVRGRYGVKLGAQPAGLNRPPGVVALRSGELVILDENALLLASPPRLPPVN